MVDVKFTYSKEGYPLKVDKASLERGVTERANKFFSQQRKSKEPTELELIVSKDGEITPPYPYSTKRLRKH
jgi:hypothetical protein